MDRRDVTSDFVGREAELGRLERHLMTAIGGQGHVVLVSGEAGIGKTFLVERFLTLTAEAHPRVRIAQGSCSERFGQGEGYLPFIQALSTLLAQTGPRSIRDKALAVVLDTAPSWLQAIPAVGQALSASYETAQAIRDHFGKDEVSRATAPDQAHMFREYTSALTRLSQENPLLLFLDDLQWSDSASVDLLVHLSRRIPGSRILILGTCRPAEVDVGRDGQPHPLRKAMLEMQRYDVCHEIALARLDQADCAALISAEFTENDFPGSFLEFLFHQSGGNALFVTEMLRFLREQGLIEEQNGIWHLTRPVTSVPLPTTVRSVVAMRIDRLGSELRRTLQCASVEGERFLSTPLATTLEMDEVQLEELVGMAERVHRFLRTAGELEIGWELTTVYQFVHILFQQALYDSLQPKQRVLLHRRIGVALEELYGDRADEIASELALHFTEGRAFDRALRYSVVAGRAAQRLYAAREAIGHYERAQRLLERVDADREQRLVIEEGLGDMRALLAELDVALEHYDRARELLVDGPGASERRASLCWKVARLYRRKGKYETAFQWLGRGLNVVGRDATPERARIYLTGAGIHSRQGKHRQALDWCQEGLAIARQLRSRPLLAHATYMLGTIHGHLGHCEEETAWARRSLALYEELGDPVGQIKALNNLGVASWGFGDWDVAIDCFRRGTALAEKIGDVNNVAIMTHNLGNILLEQGNLGAAIRAYERSLDIWETIDFPFGVASSWSGLGQAYGECGEWQTALDCLDRSERQFKEIESDLFLPEVCRRQASVHLNIDQLEEACKLVGRSLALADKLDMTLERGISLRVSGEVHLACEAWEEAEAALRESLEILREQGNQYQMGETLYQLGRLYRAEAGAGSPAGAASAGVAKAELALGKAKEIFKRLGAARALARVEEAME